VLCDREDLGQAKGAVNETVLRDREVLGQQRANEQNRPLSPRGAKTAKGLTNREIRGQQKPQRLNLHHLKPRSNHRRFTQHDSGRAVFVVAHGNGALYRAGGDTAASDGKLHVDFGKHLGVSLGALRREFDRAAVHCVSTPLEDQHHVVRRATTRASQQRFHRARCQVRAAVFGFGSVGRAVHGDHMAAAGFGHKPHTRLGSRATCPANCAFHHF
jgi:hypothetical protein